MYDAQERGERLADGTLEETRGRGNGPTETMFELDDWVKFRVRMKDG